MPPKGKAAAKATGSKPEKGKTGSANTGKASTSPVPPVEKPGVPSPPPSPVLVRFPEAATSPLGKQEDPAARCVLLTWRDRDGLYKLQTRNFSFAEKEPDHGWEDVPQSAVHARPIAGRKDIFLVTGLQSIRSEFRLSGKKEDELQVDAQGKDAQGSVANWSSAPSEPSLSVVDPAAKPDVKIVVRGNYGGPGAFLTFRSTNPDSLRESSEEALESDQGSGPLFAWPGIGICRVQARWRLLRRALPESTYQHQIHIFGDPKYNSNNDNNNNTNDNNYNDNNNNNSNKNDNNNNNNSNSSNNNNSDNNNNSNSNSNSDNNNNSNSNDINSNNNSNSNDNSNSNSNSNNDNNNSSNSSNNNNNQAAAPSLLSSSGALARSAADGEKQVGPVVDVGDACSFEVATGSWSFWVDSLPHGFVVRLEVRVGTAYRWSTWSEESDDVPVLIDPPRVQVDSPYCVPLLVTDCMATVRWAGFELAEGLSLVEYRVMVCQLAGKDDGDSVGWDARSAFVAGIFTADTSTAPTELDFDVKSLIVDMFYTIRVDARYPFVGHRDWSTQAALTQEPVKPLFADGKMPPAGPLPLPASVMLADAQATEVDNNYNDNDKNNNDNHNNNHNNDDNNSRVGSPAPSVDGNVWMALLVESWAAEDYRLEFRPCLPHQADSPQVAQPATPKDKPDEDMLLSDEEAGGKEEPADEVVLESTSWMPALQARKISVPGIGTPAWTALAVLLPDLWAGKKKGWDTVICRLRHCRPALVSPFLGTGSTSAPMVPKMAPPVLCSANLRFFAGSSQWGILLRFFLGTAPPPEAAMEEDSQLGVIGNVKRKATLQALGEQARASGSGALQAESTGNTNFRATRQHLQGHRLVTHIQLQLRRVDGESDASWTELVPTELPPVRPRHASAARMGPLPVAESKLSYGSELVWDVGDQHELCLWPTDGLVTGARYEFQVRAGTLECWSIWAAACPNNPNNTNNNSNSNNNNNSSSNNTSSSAVTFEPVAARVLPGRPGRGDPPARITLFPSSTSTITARFPPFWLPAAMGSVQYVVTAIPRLSPAEDAPGTTASLPEDCERAGEEVATTIVWGQPRVRTDEELVQSLALRGELLNLPEGLASLLNLKNLMQMETEQDLEALHKSGEVEVHLTGLLPATCYEISVLAKYPGMPCSSERLSEVSDTLCGSCPPVAPRAMPWAVAAEAELNCCQREVLLEIEERDGYELQCLPAPSAGWYDGRKDIAIAAKDKKKASGEDASSQEIRWWPSGEEEHGWCAVTTRSVRPGSGQKAGFKRVIAELGSFLTAAVGTVPPPDLASFRLAVCNRSQSHPGRWVGSESEPLLACIASVPTPPMPRRVYADGSWHLNVSFFAHTQSRPQGSMTVGQLRVVGVPQEASNWCRNELMDDYITSDGVSDGTGREGEIQGLAKLEQEPMQGGDVPAGFGHRAITLVQARVLRVGTVPHGINTVSKIDTVSVGTMPRVGTVPDIIAAQDWMELPETPLSHCKAKVPSLLQGTTAGKVGDLHALKIWLGQKTLQEGGIYVIQLRLGDGHLFSVWSQLSGRFPFAVPRPQLQASDLEVLTLSASVVQCRFPAFRVPSGVTEVSYRLRAEPTAPGSSLQGASPAEEIHLRPAVKTGTVLEANLGNLLPNTEYVFKVSARYPSIGWTTWGEGICSAPQSLCDLEADWVAPPMPLVLPRSGPRPFSLAVEGMPFFHASELAFLLAFPDTRTASDGIVYCLEYRMVGLSAASGEWQRPLELLQLEVTDSNKAQLLASCMAPWKLPPQLWRTRLPPMPQSTDSPDAVAAAHAQQVQFRLSAEMPEDCPSTRWFSSLTPPLCAAMAPPLAASGRLQVADTHLSLEVGFGLDRWLSSISADARAVAAADLQLKGGVQESSGQSLNLPRGFGHAFVSCFQVRSRHSPRPPGVQAADSSRRPPGVPWSTWWESPDAGMQAAISSSRAGSLELFTTSLALPEGAQLDYGSHYQVSVRISDGVCWSDWSEPSESVKVFVAPPKPQKPDTDVLVAVKDAGGTNVRLRWSVLKAHCGLKVIEYALHVHEVLPDGSEICPKRVAALWQGRSAGTEASPDGPEMTTHELRDLRLDVNYIFTLASRYPHVGPREFEDALSSATTSLRPCPLPLAVPMQLPMPAERLRRIQVSRCVLLRWSLAGIPSATPGGLKDFADIQVDGSDPRYDLQALPEGAGEHEWIPCRSISRLKVDGHMAWLVKDIPGRTVRSRFRLWDRDTGRFGRASPLMLSCVDAPSKLAASRVVSESSVQIALKAPAESPSGSDEYVCRFQVRYRPEQVGAPWTELPPQMIWHRQNDHLATPDEPTDGQGAVISGIGVSVARELSETEFIDGEDGGTSWTPNSVQRPPSLPTIPLAEVGTFGEVIRQRCLVTMLREEDGLQADAMYTFSMRVGDLFRLSEWSEPSGALKLAIPAPLVSIALAAAGTCITVTEVTDVSLVASWPQFVPATHAGVPVQAEVEYLLVVVPLPQKRRVVGRARPKEEIPMPLSQWLLSSKLPEGADPETVGMRPQQQLSSTIFGLAPYSNYELRLSVRYSRLGSRHWTEALSYVAVTKKSEGVQAVNALNAGKVSPPLLPGSGGFAGTEVVQAGGRAVLDPKAFLKAKDSPRGLPESPRRLPPLENPSAPPVGRPSSTGDLEEMSPEDAQEWLAGSNADIARITGGAGFRDPSAGPPTVPARQEGEPQEVGYPLVRPPEFVSFWQRDPSRPAMPAMPAASHPAAQLDLFASGSLAPRAPASDRPVLNTGRRPPDHSQVYPRRNMHN